MIRVNSLRLFERRDGTQKCLGDTPTVNRLFLCDVKCGCQPFVLQRTHAPAKRCVDSSITAVGYSAGQHSQAAICDWCAIFEHTAGPQHHQQHTLSALSSVGTAQLTAASAATRAACWSCAMQSVHSLG